MFSGQDIVFDPKISAYGENFATRIKVPVLPEEWSIGVLYGPSGSGKTTLLKTLFKVPNVYKSVNQIDQNARPIDILPEDLLLAVGMKSIPSWYTPIKYLSGGETERLICGTKMLNAKKHSMVQENAEVLVMDEFTSFVDRSTAKGMARGVGKWCSKNNIRLVVATIHKDIFPYISPSWIWSTRLEKFLDIPAVPDLNITYSKGKIEDWDYFSKYHYLQSKISPACNVYLACVDEDIVGFISLVGHIGGGKRIHRLVVFPEWQGLGIGPRILEDICKKEITNFPDIYIKTSHPSMGRYLESSCYWTPTARNKRKVSDKEMQKPFIWTPVRVACWCYKFVISQVRFSSGGLDNHMLAKRESLPDRPQKGCLKYIGKVVDAKGKAKYIRKRHPVKYFETREEAEEAQFQASAEIYNSYEIRGDDVVVDSKFSVNKRNLDILLGSTWHIRYRIVFKWENRRRVNLSDLTEDEIRIL